MRASCFSTWLAESSPACDGRDGTAVACTGNRRQRRDRGILGAYFVLYPRGRILTILPVFVFVQFIEIRAVFYLLVWFAVQLYSGIAAGARGPLVGGVAWWAHVGGFLFGVAIAPLLARGGVRTKRRGR